MLWLISWSYFNNVDHSKRYWTQYILLSFFLKICGKYVKSYHYMFRSKKEEKEKNKKKNEKTTEEEEAGVVENDDPQPSTSAQADEREKKKKKKKNKYKIQHDEISSTTVDPSSELISHMKSYQPRKYLLVKAGGEDLDSQVVIVFRNFKNSTLRLIIP